MDAQAQPRVHVQGRPGQEKPAAPAAEQAGAAEAEAQPAEQPAAPAAPPAPEDRPDSPDLLYRLGGARQAEAGERRLYADSVGGDQVAGSKHVHYHRADEAAGYRPGRVSPDELRALDEVYVGGPVHDEAGAELARRRVLLLQGAPRTGRKAAALRLLDAACGRQVFRLDPGTDLARFPEEATAPGGYLLTEPVTRASDPLRAARIAVLGERLAAHGSHLVIVLDPQAAVTGIRPLAWRPADAGRVLRAHLRRALIAALREPDGGDAERLLDLPQTGELLAGRHGPAELRDFAALLVGHLDGEVAADLLDDFVASSAAGRVAEVLDDPARELRDKAFLLALAVFEGASYQQVTAESDALTLVLRQAEDPEHHLGLTRFDRARSRLLELVHAVEERSFHENDWGRVPTSSVSFRDPGAGFQALRHLWQEHPAAREPVADWLHGLARSDAVLHRVRAAVAAGLLTSVDFYSGFGTFVEPWASSSGLRLRQLAAWALQVASEAGLLPLVQRMLRDWSGDEDVALRWTAARAYATFGVDHPDSALQDLERIVRDASREQLMDVVLDTLGALVLGGRPGPVLAALVRWSQDPSPELREACHRAFLQAAGGWDDGDGESDPWPRLLRIALRTGAAAGSAGSATAGETGQTGEPSERAETAAAVRTLWRTALGSAPFGAAAAEALAGWIAGAEQRHGLVPALAAFLPSLVLTERDRARLDHLLRQVARTGGLSAAALAELRAALAGPAAGPGTAGSPHPSYAGSAHLGTAYAPGPSTGAGRPGPHRPGADATPYPGTTPAPPAVPGEPRDTERTRG
ncbi:hypothetical protein GCM10010441_37710 [Kitasatospora paracochleata]|uniref:HEAT repeat protein n=1 Tax=Kitasatospora paracochleata TaxID=58354 RepID=A0ABT1J9F2_9ACTN|nr:hypothetical protein [Kitasatospora paracochleata]MCP2313331.1 hypothetical protein [Kitasatospora paracochleata]